MNSDKHTVIIGAGPAGLTAGYLLSKAAVPVTVLESDHVYVGGIARTASYKGYLFDIGGHRFFSKSAEVEALWTELLPHDMLDRPRSSRIYYRGQFFPYPLKPAETLMKLGVLETLHCVWSYAKVRVSPVKNVRSFEDWVVNQFGRRLYEIFFKTYTEKVWGMSCRQISADWAAQRIKGLSLSSAVWNAIRPARPRSGATIKTLIDSFRYPRRGPGMMWEAATRRILEMGGEVKMGADVSACHFDRRLGKWRVVYATDQGERELTATHVISSAPLRELVNGITPSMTAASISAANALRYRDFLTVVLILRDKQLFDDNWIYVHDPGVRVGRVQNFKSWSPEMVPDPETACYGLEYFCFEGDGLWTSSDDELLKLGTSELVQIGLASAGDVLDGCVVRQRKAYPVYDDTYASNVAQIRSELNEHYPNLHLVGRNGMHKYNNQDHAMMTAMLCVKNILAGHQVYDVWRVNQDAEYHEEGSSGSVEETGLRGVPQRVEG